MCEKLAYKSVHKRKILNITSLAQDRNYIRGGDKMDIEIIPEIIERTTECDVNFSCLSDQTDLCEIKSVNPFALHFIKHPKNSGCRYYLPFGYSNHICICPTRQEIYRRYDI
jgi:hypothetical protein